MRSYRVRMDPNPMYSVLKRRDKRGTDTQGRMPCEDGGRNESGVSASQKYIKTCQKPPDARNKA